MIPVNLVYDESTQEGTIFLDNSGIEVFDTCQRKAELYLCWRRESNKEKPALKFGGIVHKMLEHRYKNISKSTAELAQSMIDIAAGEFHKWTPPDGDHRNFAMAVDVIMEYVNKYPFESFDLATLNGLPAVEVPFACPFRTIEVNTELWIWDGTTQKKVFITKIHVVIKGKMDIALRREGRLYLMDHKTTSMMGPTYFADYEISAQKYTYVWACQQLLNEVPYGFTVNALGVRAPTKSGKKLDFQRHTTMVYQSLIAEWCRDTESKIADFLECARREYFPKQTKWCMGKYGACEYHGVCSLEPEMRSTALATNEFKDVTWDPLKTEE